MRRGKVNILEYAASTLVAKSNGRLGAGAGHIKSSFKKISSNFYSLLNQMRLGVFAPRFYRA
ncbi:hypothetical protein J6TS1_22570 [Siminovitchia terrae]|uniref:Uncharacterized protein n=1 Tax=Siminovitchia terrae TaxID=1914933 RepID=A0ABQ4KXI8_SIMTE|nr:hypothetical protein J6TS1_22570 [Siminovitchia terrae]